MTSNFKTLLFILAILSSSSQEHYAMANSTDATAAVKEAEEELNVEETDEGTVFSGLNWEDLHSEVHNSLLSSKITRTHNSVKITRKILKSDLKAFSVKVKNDKSFEFVATIEGTNQHLQTTVNHPNLILSEKGLRRFNNSLESKKTDLGQTLQTGSQAVAIITQPQTQTPNAGSALIIHQGNQDANEQTGTPLVPYQQTQPLAVSDSGSVSVQNFNSEASSLQGTAPASVSTSDPTLYNFKDLPKSLRSNEGEQISLIYNKKEGDLANIGIKFTSAEQFRNFDKNAQWIVEGNKVVAINYNGTNYPLAKPSSSGTSGTPQNPSAPAATTTASTGSGNTQNFNTGSPAPQSTAPAWGNIPAGSTQAPQSTANSSAPAATTAASTKSGNTRNFNTGSPAPQSTAPAWGNIHASPSPSIPVKKPRARVLHAPHQEYSNTKIKQPSSVAPKISLFERTIKSANDEIQ